MLAGIIIALWLMAPRPRVLQDSDRGSVSFLWNYHQPEKPIYRIQVLESMGKKDLIGGRRDCLVPSLTLDEMRQRRQNRMARPALTKHTPIKQQQRK